LGIGFCPFPPFFLVFLHQITGLSAIFCGVQKQMTFFFSFSGGEWTLQLSFFFFSFFRLRPD